ncbi:MAG: cobalamin-binding protein [Pseudomonadota bacterium]
MNVISAKRRAPALVLLASLSLTLAAAPAQAAVTVIDDNGTRVTLSKPARRVISMAPHVTELLFAAGGGARVVGAMNFSDYPEAAKKIPLVGSSSQLDMERMIALKPDLLVVWQSGNTARQLEQLRQLGIPMFYSEPTSLDQVADSVLRLGQLMGTDAAARAAAGAFRAKIAALEDKYSKRAPVRTFYQIWDRPLYTLNGKQIASDVMRVCGGVNVFGQLLVKAPEVSIEAVIKEDPEVILGGDKQERVDAGLNVWKPFTSMLAVKRGNVFTVNGEQLTRAGLRLADGATEMCEKLELARQRRR